MPLYRNTDAGTCRFEAEDAERIRAFLQEGGFSTDELGTLSGERGELIRRIARGEAPIAPLSPERPRERTGERFQEYARREGIEVLRVLQEGVIGTGRCAWVWLARDPDGIVKVYKEIVEEPGDPSMEAGALACLAGPRGVPSCYGIADLGADLRLLRLSFLSGRPLADRSGWRPSLDEARAIGGELAALLGEVHRRGVVHLDVRPGNVLLHPEGARLLDFGSARVLDEKGEATAPPRDPKYAPPESLWHRASPASDVFSLGVLLFRLWRGEPPLSLSRPDLPAAPGARGEELRRYTLAHALLPPPESPEWPLLGAMLDPDPARRPTMEEVAVRLGPPRRLRIPQGLPRIPTRNTILFPARMGVPHRGHIDYITRILDLGYHVIISLQRAFTITRNDPYPKTWVMKMVAASLRDAGFGPGDATFIFTPYFRTTPEHRLHFAMMPGREDVVGVASGNPEVHALLDDLPAFDQASVFGREGEPWEVRSWGSRLRAAIREGDRATFADLAASGIEAVRPFDELHARYAETPVEFVYGKVYVELFEGERRIARTRVLRYLPPEESLARAIGARILDLWAPDTAILWEGRERALRHEGTTLDAGDETLVYRLS